MDGVRWTAGFKPAVHFFLHNNGTELSWTGLLLRWNGGTVKYPQDEA
ncbi:hypothetical protein [Paenibacillus sp. MYb63]|nr:hypothetical protein [Paenibacillus sp. MYb63]